MGRTSVNHNNANLHIVAYNSSEYCSMNECITQVGVNIVQTLDFLVLECREPFYEIIGQL